MELIKKKELQMETISIFVFSVLGRIKLKVGFDSKNL